MLKNVLTLGPSSKSEDTIRSLLEVADRFRLNTSHMDADILTEWVLKLEQIFKSTGRSIPVVIDLQGSKMRIGKYPEIKLLPKYVSLVFEEASLFPEEIPVPHKPLFNALNIGDILFLNDARISIEITKLSNNKANAVVLTNGPLSSNKGINRKQHPIPFQELSFKDSEMIRIAKQYSFTEFAFSFVHNGTEADKIRHCTGKHNIIAKIERSEAFSYIETIDKCFDEIWLCRGDLGAQIGVLNLGELQKSFVKKTNSLNKDCFLAGQVLEHMTYFPEPTRSEVVHLFDTEQNNFKGFVLSDETAVGKNINAIINFLRAYRKKGSY